MLYILSKKECIHLFNFNHFLIRTKMFNSIRIYYSPLLSAMDSASITKVTQAWLGCWPIKEQPQTNVKGEYWWQKSLLLAIIQFSDKSLTGKTQNFPTIVRNKSSVLPEHRRRLRSNDVAVQKGTKNFHNRGKHESKHKNCIEKGISNHQIDNQSTINP